MTLYWVEKLKNKGNIFLTVCILTDNNSESESNLILIVLIGKKDWLINMNREKKAQVFEHLFSNRISKIYTLM